MNGFNFHDNLIRTVTKNKRYQFTMGRSLEKGQGVMCNVNVYVLPRELHTLLKSKKNVLESSFISWTDQLFFTLLHLESILNEVKLSGNEKSLLISLK